MQSINIWPQSSYFVAPHTKTSKWAQQGVGSDDTITSPQDEMDSTAGDVTTQLSGEWCGQQAWSQKKEQGTDGFSTPPWLKQSVGCMLQWEENAMWV